MNIKFIQMPKNSMVHTMMQWNNWKKVNEKWKFTNYYENCFLQFNFSNVGQLCGSQTLLNVNYFKSMNQEFLRYAHLHIGLKNLQITFRRKNLQIQVFHEFISGWGEILIISSNSFSLSRNLYCLYLMC